MGRTERIKRKNKITIHKNNINKIIFKEELNFYIEQGWIIGGKKLKKEFIWMYKDEISIRVRKEEILKYKNKGYKRGRNYKNNKGKIRIYNINTNEEKCIDKEDYKLYDKNLWIQGRKKGFTPWPKERNRRLTDIHKQNISKGMLNVNKE